jgi:hypothetical protein
VELVRNGLDLDYFKSQVERYAEAREKQDPQYTKCIQNWLKDGDWKGTYGVTLMEKLMESQKQSSESKKCPCGAPLQPHESPYCSVCTQSMKEDADRTLEEAEELRKHWPNSQWD